MSSHEDKVKRSIDENAKREIDNCGGSSEKAHRRWSERARESEKTVVHRKGPRPVPTTHRIPIKIVVHKD